jgi:hypothetical protein
MVGDIMTSFHRSAFSKSVTALAVATRALVNPGTLVFLG